MRNILKILALCLLPVSVLAQETSMNLGGIKGNQDLPIETSALSMEIDQNTGSVVMKGDVIITQGTMKLAAEQVDLFLNDETQELERMIATGGVDFTADKDTAKADTAEFNIETQTLLMKNNVTLTQGQIAIFADTMTVDTQTGNASLRGNVRTILQPGTAQ